MISGCCNGDPSCRLNQINAMNREQLIESLIEAENEVEGLQSHVDDTYQWVSEVLLAAFGAEIWSTIPANLRNPSPEQR